MAEKLTLLCDHGLNTGEYVVLAMQRESLDFVPDQSASIFTEPFGCLEFLHLNMHSKMVLTDSGGLQEETTVLGIPCITMRSNTERPITCEVGTNTIVGNDPLAILGAAQAVLAGESKTGEIPEK